MVQPTAEGATPLSADEEEGLIPGHIETHPELNEWEQANILEAEVWLEERALGEPVLSMAFLRELHRRMFDKTWSWAGTLRTTEKNIGDPPDRVQENLKNLLDDTQYWIENGTYGADELGARFHHRLVKIHPFANGNGRHGRLMTDVLLEELGVEPFTWGSANLDKPGLARTAYLSALRAADKGDYRELIAFARS